MIPYRMRIFLFIIFTFFSLQSCQKKTSNTPKPKNTKPEIEEAILTADRFYSQKEFDSAFFYYNKLRSICNPVTDSENYITSLNRMAEIQQDHADYTGSENTIKEVLPYLKYAKKQSQIWSTYVILSINYLNTYDYKNAILYNQKALRLQTEEWRKLAARNNIAVILMEEGKYNEALQIFLSLTTKKEVLNNDEFQNKALDNIGFCYFKTHNPNEALLYFNKSLEIRQRKNRPFDLGKSYLHFAKFYEKSNSALAKEYMLLSYEKFTAANSVEDRMSSLELLIKNTSDQELRKYATKYVNIVDSIFEVRQKVKNQFARIKYDSKREREENLKLKSQKIENELQIERQENRNIISYIIILVALSLVVILYFYLTSRANRQKIEATYQSETRISKKLHDELANDVYHTMAFIENKNLSIAKNRENLLKNLRDIYSLTSDISKENCPLVANKNYAASLNEMISEFNNSETNILTKGLDTILWSEIKKNKKVAVYRTIQELLVNMKKHSSATSVLITFKKTNKNILIIYVDNGKGIDANQVLTKNGLNNIENRIFAINGSIDIDSFPDKGFKVFIKFPIIR
ncbi:tetratricopeptide repeat-containing sensor histidine kinase [Flavobacterium lipolyticum]|uniref:Tetratricopeptide repeat protein n=1 Tax=Flavobacterium lipolyticum TaxID=2893754 RepID=A0ABS8LW45_9FLAO|nr:tetratricopeptide repeat-containing sensor histidine kinase [Flavobacterium sp. F-126]MCC9016795.1 tetratricopeptide repeat protein [Flavobacterium sp. F-126]